MKIHDYIVVGSGCSAAMVAETLVEAGKNVTVIDAGQTSDYKDPSYGSYLDLRKKDKNQMNYFLGKKLEGISWDKLGKGAQLTPPRLHMIKGVDTYIPIRSTSFSPVESLGYGGLGIGWGVQCWEFSDAELRNAGLNVQAMRKAYQTVSERIGVSGTKDAAQRYTLGTLRDFQESPSMDQSHQKIYDRYLKKHTAMKNQHAFIGRTPLGVITRDDKNGSRKAYQYRDMDYYDDADQSSWRPWITFNELKKNPNFAYIGGLLVTAFDERSEYTEVSCINMSNGKKIIYRTKKLILATGAIESGRIVLRSNKDYDSKLSLLCNPYTYVPSLHPSVIGKGAEEKKLGFGQLSMFIDKDGKDNGLSVASTYSYQSLMLFRIIRQFPLNFKDALALARYLVSGIVIVGIHHPDYQSKDKYITLSPDPTTITGDILDAEYLLDDKQRSNIKQSERHFIKLLRTLNVFALTRINPGFGSSIHYAGTLPFNKKPTQYNLAPSGKLHFTRSVYVADSSGFNFLPARGLTFSLLANAHLVAQNVLKDD